MDERVDAMPLDRACACGRETAVGSCADPLQDLTRDSAPEVERDAEPERDRLQGRRSVTVCGVVQASEAMPCTCWHFHFVRPEEGPWLAVLPPSAMKAGVLRWLSHAVREGRLRPIAWLRLTMNPAGGFTGLRCAYAVPDADDQRVLRRGLGPAGCDAETHNCFLLLFYLLGYARFLLAGGACAAERWVLSPVMLWQFLEEQVYGRRPVVLRYPELLLLVQRLSWMKLRDATGLCWETDFRVRVVAQWFQRSSLEILV